MAPISRGLSLVSVLESVWLSAALGISFPMHSLPRSPEGSQGHSPLLQSPAATCSCQQQLLLPGWEVSTGHTPQGPEAVLKRSGTTQHSVLKTMGLQPGRGGGRRPTANTTSCVSRPNPAPHPPAATPKARLQGPLEVPSLRLLWPHGLPY